MNDLMIDLETLGTGPTAMILAIGAVRFDLVSGKIDDNGFYASISVDSNIKAGRTMSEDTLVWWMKQPDAARALFSEEKLHIDAALDQFAEWVGEPKDVRPWGNGPTFDLVKLTHAYEQREQTAPWVFWNERCLRTYRALPGAKAVPRVEPQIAHHALHDAHAQAQWVINIHKHVFLSPTSTVRKNPMVKTK